MTTRTLAVVSAGLGQPSSTRLLADRLAEATVAAVRDHGDDVVVEVIELRELAHDLTDHLLTGFASEPLQAAKDTVSGADGVIAVTPIFSASYNGLFKNFFDVLDDHALTDAPVLIAATAGTARHSLALEHALRPLFAYLRAVVVPTAVFAAAEDWGGGGEVDGGLAARIKRAAGQLADLVVGAPTRRSASNPFADPIPFEQLLRGQ
ncbi:FMN reductase [Egicoccus sp. AB-alg6-2]|uniref:FMN reductase n=1 Tax=Egicoccus sp. AB-alg6-2 TaxID=3242692 RepID=UPI00359D2D73